MNETEKEPAAPEIISGVTGSSDIVTILILPDNTFQVHLLP